MLFAFHWIDWSKNDNEGGSKMKHLFPAIVVLITFSLFSFTFAQDIPEHPIIKPYPGSVLAKNMSKYQNFGEFEFTIQDNTTNKKENKKVQGKYWHLLWEVRKANGDRVQNISKVEFLQNFKNAALQAGGEVLYEDQLYLHFRIPRASGGYSWCRVHTNAGLGQVYMTIIDEKGYEQSIVFLIPVSTSIYRCRNRYRTEVFYHPYPGRLLTDRQQKQLSQIVALMLKYPTLHLEIQGHTDNQGQPSYNMNLSNSRAETVKTYLQLFGTDSNRLIAKGYGETRPVASNETEQGRAKNRRVELAKVK
jgi:hypothetical protein